MKRESGENPGQSRCCEAPQNSEYLSHWPACREGFGTGASQKTCQIDSMSDSPEGWPFDFGSDSTRKEYRKRRGTDPFAVAGPAAWRRLAVDDGRTPPDGHPRTTADTAGPHKGPQEAAPPRRRPSPPDQAADGRRQLRLAALRDLNPLPQIIRTPHPTAAASDPFLSILKRRGTQGLVVCHNNKSSKKYSIRG
mgnify:CR=1 FL=1